MRGFAFYGEAGEQHDKWFEETGFGFESEEEVVEWLSGQSPDVWHVVALGWNWSMGAQVPIWIVSQPACDFGTAAYIYFLNAGNYLGPDEDADDYANSDGFMEVEIIARRMREGTFPTAEFVPIHPEDDPKNHVERVRHHRELMQRFDGTKLAQALAVPEAAYSYSGSRFPETEIECFDAQIFKQTFRSWLIEHGYKPPE